MASALTRRRSFPDYLVVRADMPGLKPEDIKIKAEDDILTVSGEHEES
jgi:HSP20 family molecular chaperone IbpA